MSVFIGWIFWVVHWWIESKIMLGNGYKRRGWSLYPLDDGSAIPGGLAWFSLQHLLPSLHHLTYLSPHHQHETTQFISYIFCVNLTTLVTTWWTRKQEEGPKQTDRKAGKCSAVSLITPTDQNLARQVHSSDRWGSENDVSSWGYLWGHPQVKLFHPCRGNFKF